MWRVLLVAAGVLLPAQAALEIRPVLESESVSVDVDDPALWTESGFRGDREGIAIAGDYVIATDQLETGSQYHIFDRISLNEIGVWHGSAESTDGIEASSQPLGPRFRSGIFIVMNNAGKNFQLYALPER